MSNNKQSSIEWLQAIELERDLTLADWNKAKAMEKKQCVDFALKCMLNGLEPHKSTRDVVEKMYEENLQ